ncbi:T9SS type A sorting domain-containing protein [Flavisolibacter sp. BT320]|nr:T9SS type A sorting domain-containing protein [Flavisolibacter longurius]
MRQSNTFRTATALYPLVHGYLRSSRYFLLLTGLLMSGGLFCQQVYRQAGPSPASIQSTVDAFREAIGGGSVPNYFGGGFGTLRTEINWENLDDFKAAPASLNLDYLKGHFYQGRVFYQGVVFSTPGTGFQVSARPGNLTATASEFGNINPSYPSLFAPFSGQRLFTPLGSNIMDVSFFVPSTELAARTRGFGAVFTDVDGENGITAIQYFDQNGTLLTEAKAIPVPGNETFSFVGVLFPTPVVARVRIVTGNTAPGPNEVLPTEDLVALDDFIYGTPVSEGNPCILTCHENIITSARPQICEGLVSYPLPARTAGCGQVEVLPGPPYFPVGVTTVTARAASGDSCSFTITVVDNVPPMVFGCLQSQTFCTNASGTYTVEPFTSFGDNCTPVSVRYTISGATTRAGTGNNASGAFNEGTSTIRWTVTDANGNSSACTSQVTVSSSVMKATITTSRGSSSAGLSYKYYEGSWTSLPDFGGLQPVATGRTANVSLAPRNRDDNFAFLWEGTITIAQAGTYYFETASDDGSRLYIGNYSHYVTPVVNNDGQHAEQLAGGWYTFPAAGVYPIAITYFEAGGAEAMKVYWTAPQAGIPTRTPIPDAAFTPPASPLPSLTYKYYEGSWTQLPDFGGLTPLATGQVDKVDISTRQQDNNFAFLWEGTINIPKAGRYYFETASDDGSKLYIGNYGHYITPVVDNDREHPRQFAGGWYSFPQAGTYPIAISFFEAGGSQGIEVYWTSPDAGIPTRMLIPNTAFQQGTGVVCSAEGVTLTASNGNTYLWSTGAVTPGITVRENGSYTVTVTKDGCSATSEPLVISCFPGAARVGTGAQIANVKEESIQGSLVVTVAPNPSHTSFTLQVRSAKAEAVTIRVTDGLGRTVNVIDRVAPNSTHTIGQHFRPGVYLVEIMQGKYRSTVKLVKSAD